MNCNDQTINHQPSTIRSNGLTAWPRGPHPCYDSSSSQKSYLVKLKSRYGRPKPQALWIETSRWNRKWRTWSLYVQTKCQRPLHQDHLPAVQRAATTETRMWTDGNGKQIYCGQKHTVRPYTLMTCNAHTLIEVSKLPVIPQWLRCSILFTRVWHREVHKNNCGLCACVSVWVRNVLCTDPVIFIILHCGCG